MTMLLLTDDYFVLSQCTHRHTNRQTDGQTDRIATAVHCVALHAVALRKQYGAQAPPCLTPLDAKNSRRPAHKTEIEWPAYKLIIDTRVIRIGKPCFNNKENNLQ